MAARTSTSPRRASRSSKPPVRKRAAQTSGNRGRYSSHVRDVLEGLTAAAEVLSSADKKKQLPGPNNLTRTWQHAAFGYTHTVPELGAAVLYVGNCLARVRLKVGRRMPDGSVDAGFVGAEPIDNDADDDEKPDPDAPSQQLVEQAEAIVSTIRSKIGGPSELLRSYGEKMFIAGEMFLLPEDGPAGLTFEALSTQELRVDGDTYVRYLGPGADAEPVPEDVDPIRVHRPDPQFSRLANSSVRSCLEILEELVVLTRLVRSSAISRMALAGILAIADEFDEPQGDEGPDGQTAEQQNALTVDIITTGAKAIDDPASAAAWLPYILQGPADLIEKGIRFIEFKRDDAVNVVKRREALERLAQGLDLPVEVILGHQQTTFANAAQISEDTFKIHIEPMVQMFCDAVTLGILWPALAAMQGLDAERVDEVGYPEELLRVAVTFDASELISRPDRTKDVIEAYRADQSQTAIRNEELRLAVGLTAGDVPDDDEVQRRIAGIQLIKAREQIQLPQSDAPSTQDLFGADGTSSNGTGLPPPAMPGANGQPVTASAVVNLEALAAANVLGQRIIAACELTMERIAERIGNTVRNKARGATADMIAGIPAADVPRMVGPQIVTELLNGSNPAPAELAAFTRTVARWAKEAGHAQPGAVAQRAAEVAATAVAERLYGNAGALTPQTVTTLAALP